MSGVGASDQVVKAPATGGAITAVTPGRRAMSSVTYDAKMQTMAYVKATAESPAEAFVANAMHHVTDEVITQWMQAAFPGRESQVFSKVAGVRYKYNRGGFKQTQGVPSTPSQRYDEAGNVATARGKSLLPSPGEPAGGEPAPKKATKKSPAKK